MTYIAEILLAIVNVIMAYYHSVLIKEGKRIKHGLWGGAYLILAIVFSWCNANFFLLLSALFIRKVVFDISLNLFRGLPIFYVSTSTTSIVDKFLYKIFGKEAWIYQTLFVIKIIILNIYFL